MKKALSVLSVIVLLLSACSSNWLADRNDGVAMSFLLAGSVLATGWLIYRHEVKERNAR
jgi:uncharacterized protein YcfL